MKLAGVITYIEIDSPDDSFFGSIGAEEVSLLETLNGNRAVPLDGFFVYLSDTVFLVCSGIVLALLVKGHFRKDSLIKKAGIIIGASCLTAALIATAFKYAVDRPRPFVTYPFLEKLSTGGSPSFPSGHTSDAFAFAIALSLCFPRWYVVMPAVLWALGVAYSRMCLGVHYPSDVLAGALFGASAALLCSRLFAKPEPLTPADDA